MVGFLDLRSVKGIDARAPIVSQVMLPERGECRFPGEKLPHRAFCADALRDSVAFGTEKPTEEAV
ncbi:MAG: hypothetical protein EA346_09415 [Thioalkalivibrio sp.]|nr:MAG: hypothetical protein EA346_09415 [Thioalkalivibrio sp.]